MAREPIAKPFRPFWWNFAEIAGVWRENDTQRKKLMPVALETYRKKRKFGVTPEPRGRKGPRRRAPLCDPEARGAPAALRSAARTRRRDEELGGDARPEPRSRRKTPRRAGRGSSDRIQRLRGHDPGRRIWRRHRDDLGSRQLVARRRSAQGLGQGPSGFRSRRREAARPLASGAHARARKATATTIGC